jgi:RNA polymerase sigma factor (sigma-70 family)
LDKENDSINLDPALWQRIREGDESALETLYKRHFLVLSRYGLKLAKDKELTQDCVQEVFFQLWVRRDKLKSVQSVRFYLMKWLKREIVRKLNDKHSGNNVISLEGELGDFGLVVDDMVEKKEVQGQKAAQIRIALNSLTNREREVIYMRFFLELTYEEICLELNLSYQVVMNYMHRALKSLRTNNLIQNILRSVLVGYLLFTNSF